jgi:hypothetical protein
VHIGWPQGIYLTLTAIGLLRTVYQQMGSRNAGDAVATVAGQFIATGLMVALLWWGGFFN